MEMAVRSVHMQIHFYTMESNLHVLHIQLAGSRARSQSQIRMVNGTKRGNNSLLSVCRTTFGHTYISGIFSRKKNSHTPKLRACSMICSMSWPLFHSILSLSIICFFKCKPRICIRIIYNFIMLIMHLLCSDDVLSVFMYN